MTPISADKGKQIRLACGCETRRVHPEAGTRIVTCRICRTPSTITVAPHTFIDGWFMATVTATPRIPA